MAEFTRRLPSVQRKIAEIKQDDMRVRILGTVVAKNGNRIVLDDGTGRISVSFNGEPDAKIKQFVRVFGRVIPLDEGVEIQGEILQDMSGLDTELLKKLEELEEKFKNNGTG
jgi:uncharacterized protein YdeI (BOF family)